MRAKDIFITAGIALVAGLAGCRSTKSAQRLSDALDAADAKPYTVQSPISSYTCIGQEPTAEKNGVIVHYVPNDPKNTLVSYDLTYSYGLPHKNGDSKFLAHKELVSARLIIQDKGHMLMFGQDHIGDSLYSFADTRQSATAPTLRQVLEGSTEWDMRGMADLVANRQQARLMLDRRRPQGKKLN